MAILELHKINVGGGGGVTGSNYYCMLNPNTYTSIASIVGIAKVTDEAEKNNPTYTVAELIRAGIVQRMICSGKATGNKPRSFNLLVARDKLSSALDGIKGKTINGVTVGAGRIKRTATFY